MKKYFSLVNLASFLLIFLVIMTLISMKPFVSFVSMKDMPSGLNPCDRQDWIIENMAFGNQQKLLLTQQKTNMLLQGMCK